jgi:hypothetical protein
LLVALLLAATMALRKLTTEGTEENGKKKIKTALVWWCVAGLIGGIAVMMRPDAGLFLAAVGITLVITGLGPLVFGLRKKTAEDQRPKTKELGPKIRRIITRVIAAGAAMSFAFILVLTPWAIRNWRVFHLFQPLAPQHAEMPGEFVPRGYLLWVRSWLDDEKYVAEFLWPLEIDPIDADQLPDSAFDSPEEKKRVATLLEKYNHADASEDSDANDAAPQQTASPTPTPSASPPSPVEKPNSNEENSDEEQEDSTDQEQSDVEMTPDVDAGFMKIARERIARHPFRHYVWLPIKRARTMWFDTHSQYWPFEGELLPLDDLDHDIHQQFWLPLFAGMTAVYTLLGLAGAWVLWRARNFGARQWLLLIGLAIGLRVVLFASLENPRAALFR